MRCTVPLFGLLVLALGCRETRDGSGGVAGPRASSANVPTPAASAPPSAHGAEPTASSARLTHEAPGPQVPLGELEATRIFPWDGRGLVVGGRYDADANQSDVIAQRLDPTGKRVGSSHVVRRTSGHVLRVGASLAHGRAWFAWVSLLDEQSGKALVGAIGASADLGSIDPAPITVSMFRSPLPLDEAAAVEVATTADGGAFLVTNGPEAFCPAMHAAGEREPCNSIDAFIVSPIGKTERVRRHGLNGGLPFGVDGLVDGRDGFLYATHATRGGTFFHVFATTHGGRDDGRFALEKTHGYRGLRALAATTSTVAVVYASFADSTDPSGAVPDPRSGGTESVLRVRVRDGRGRLSSPVTATGLDPAVLRRSVDCSGETPVERLGFSGGELALPVSEGVYRFGDEVWIGRVFARLDNGVVTTRECNKAR